MDGLGFLTSMFNECWQKERGSLIRREFCRLFPDVADLGQQWLQVLIQVRHEASGEFGNGLCVILGAERAEAFRHQTQKPAGTLFKFVKTVADGEAARVIGLSTMVEAEIISHGFWHSGHFG